MERDKEEGNGGGEGCLSLEAKPCTPISTIFLKY